MELRFNSSYAHKSFGPKNHIQTRMSTRVAVESIAEFSPRAKARIAGVFEALEGVASSQGQVFILGRLVVAGSPAATAANIMQHERLFWLGFALSVAGVAFHIAWISLSYFLFKPVNRTTSLLAALVGVVVCAMQAVTLLYLAPLFVLRGGNSVGGLRQPQLQTIAMIFMKLNSSAFDIFDRPAVSQKNPLRLRCGPHLGDAAKPALGVHELREQTPEILLLRRQREPHSFRGRFSVKLPNIGNRESQLDGSCGVLLRRGMQCERRFPGHEFAPAGRLELQLEPEHVTVKLHGAVHVGNEFNHIAQLHGGVLRGCCQILASSGLLLFPLLRVQGHLSLQRSNDLPSIARKS
jgi:hypothetical protein